MIGTERRSEHSPMQRLMCASDAFQDGHMKVDRRLLRCVELHNPREALFVMNCSSRQRVSACARTGKATVATPCRLLQTAHRGLPVRCPCTYLCPSTAPPHRRRGSHRAWRARAVAGQSRCRSAQRRQIRPAPPAADAASLVVCGGQQRRCVRSAELLSALESRAIAGSDSERRCPLCHVDI